VEIRKGVLALAKAVPIVVQKNKNVLFNIIGKPDKSPYSKGTMIDLMKAELGEYTSFVNFKEPVPLNEIPAVLARTTVCVFPSIWENFPNVCLEAMSAGRAIVASDQGGMRDMLEDVNGGILINPEDHLALANSILFLLNNPQERMKMGDRARNKAIDYYSNKLINEVDQFYRETASSD
jgi:glycogen synthase